LEELVLGGVFSVGVVDCVKVSLEVSEGEFIGRFEFAVVFVVLLYCVVGEVYEFVVEILHVELLGGSADVAILIPVPLLVAVAAVDADVGTNVEFAFLVEEGHDVLLDYVGAWTSLFVHCVCSYYCFDLLDALHYLYSCASVCVLAWFDEPGVATFGLEAFHRLVFGFLVFVVDGVCPSVELFLKLREFLISQFSDVKCHGDVVEWVDFLCVVVVLQIHKEGLFV